MDKRWIGVFFCTLLGAAGAAAAAEPPVAACQPVATVFGKPVCPEEIEPKAAPSEQVLKARAERLYTVVQMHLFHDYAKKKHLEPTDSEMKRLGKLFGAESEFKRGLPREEVEKSQKLFYGTIIQSWKVNRSLYRRYGGRVLSSGFGFSEPVDAIKTYLRDQEKSGTFTIHQPELAKEFWQALEQRADTAVTGKDARDAFATPPWEARPER